MWGVSHCVVLICISLIISDVEHLLMCLLAISLERWKVALLKTDLAPRLQALNKLCLVVGCANYEEGLVCTFVKVNSTWSGTWQNEKEKGVKDTAEVPTSLTGRSVYYFITQWIWGRNYFKGLSLLRDLESNFLPKVGIFWHMHHVVLLKYMAAISMMSKGKSLELSREEWRFVSISAKLPK